MKLERFLVRIHGTTQFAPYLTEYGARKPDGDGRVFGDVAEAYDFGSSAAALEWLRCHPTHRGRLEVVQWLTWSSAKDCLHSGACTHPDADRCGQAEPSGPNRRRCRCGECHAASIVEAVQKGQEATRWTPSPAAIARIRDLLRRVQEATDVLDRATVVVERDDGEQLAALLEAHVERSPDLGDEEATRWTPSQECLFDGTCSDPATERCRNAEPFGPRRVRCRCAACHGPGEPLSDEEFADYLEARVKVAEERS